MVLFLMFMGIYRQNGKVSPECHPGSVYRSAVAMSPYEHVTQQAAYCDMLCDMTAGLDGGQAPYRRASSINLNIYIISP